MANKRILDETTASVAASDDYLYIDGATNGSRKITPENIVLNSTTAQLLTQHIADATQEVGEIEDDITDIKADLGDLAELDTTDKSSIVNAINEVAGGSGSGVPTTVRSAMLALFEAAAYAETGLTDEIAVIESWAEEVTDITLNNSTISISGSGTSQLTATTVPSGATVSWSSSNTAIATVSSSGLVTGVSNGTATITASAGDMSATCTATVSGFVTLTSISAVYTQSGTVYDTDTLDSLKTDLVVTAHYDNSTTSTVASTDYTLSGTLTAGTSTITVSYGGKTTTFNVTVTHDVTYIQTGLIHRWDGIDNTLNGHDGSATSWYDLVGIDHLVMNNSSLPTWETNALSFPKEAGQYLLGTYDAESVGTQTVEMCFLPAESHVATLFIPLKDTTLGKISIFADNTFGVNGASGNTYQNPESAITALNHIAVVIENGSITAAYGNGTVASLSTKTHSMSDVNSKRVLGQADEGSGSNRYPFNGKIFSARIYNRALSASEIASNYAVDVTRFELGA